MASGYLIRSDAQAIGHDPAHELGRGEPGCSQAAPPPRRGRLGAVPEMVPPDSAYPRQAGPDPGTTRKKEEAIFLLRTL